MGTSAFMQLPFFHDVVDLSFILCQNCWNPKHEKTKNGGGEFFLRWAKNSRQRPHRHTLVGDPKTGKNTIKQTKHIEYQRKTYRTCPEN
jgi:hypothetical protein